MLGEAAPGYDKADFTRITPNEYLTQAAPLERVDHSSEGKPLRGCGNKGTSPDSRMGSRAFFSSGKPGRSLGWFPTRA